MAQLSLQVVYLSLHGLLIILALEYVTAHTRLASASLSDVHTSLSKPSILFISITQGWESYPIVGIKPIQADGSLLDEGLILPCLIVAFTNTQVLPTDCANYRDWV